MSNKNIGEDIILSGWIDTKRDHGGVLFLDIRDNYGMIQIVADNNRCKIDNLDILAKVHNESVVRFEGKVVERSKETKNPNLKNGDIEVLVNKYKILSDAETLPFQVNEDDGCNEEYLRRKEQEIFLSQVDYIKVDSMLYHRLLSNLNNC